MKILRALILAAIGTTMIGCVNTPRNKRFLASGTSEPIPLDGIADRPDKVVQFQAFNFTTGNWDMIARTITSTNPFTKDFWYGYEAPAKVLGPDYWEAVTQKPTYRRRAKVRALYEDSAFVPFAYFNQGEETDQCILDNYEASGTSRARDNCWVPNQAFAYVHSCKFPPCTPWL